MKFLAVLMLVAVAAAAPNVEKSDAESGVAVPHNVLVNALVRQLFEFLRRTILNGNESLGIPVLDPLQLEEFHLDIPAGLINLKLDLNDADVRGFGGFVVRKSHLNLHDLSFDVDILFPRIDVFAALYDLVGDLFTAVPLYGRGRALFEAQDFNFQAKLYIKQSKDGKSILIERIENASYHFPHLKSQLDGVIGGGPIDDITNALVEEVIFDYVNRFQGAIATVVSGLIVEHGNPHLDKLDTWRFIAPLIRN